MKVITFSRNYPKGHPRAGEPTFFVEKIWQGLHTLPLQLSEIANHVPELEAELKNHYTKVYDPKWHTIRSGRRWKVGDWFQPRVWGTDVNPKSGKSGPYQSKQIDISIPIQIKQIWDFWMDKHHVPFLSGVYLFDEYNNQNYSIDEIALNDGLESTKDFIDWFKIHPKKKETFQGQILCWSDNIKYD